MELIRRSGLVAAITLVACWSNAQPTTTPVGNTGQPLAQQADPLEGEYWCAIDDYPNFRCTIEKTNGHLVLAKHGGSQRFTGEIVARNGGFTFDGKFYCPHGACDQPLHGEFRETTPGEMHATFESENSQIQVSLVRAQPGAFGGNGYGGNGYGGNMYGGMGYGGNGYGGRGGFHKPRHH